MFLKNLIYFLSYIVYIEGDSNFIIERAYRLLFLNPYICCTLHPLVLIGLKFTTFIVVVLFFKVCDDGDLHEIFDA